jgi:K(+)-stimulated pyrophosphate-energized sodium pump
MSALYKGLIVAGVLAAHRASTSITDCVMRRHRRPSIGGTLSTDSAASAAAVVGLVLTGRAWSWITEYYTGTEYAPGAVRRRRPPRPATRTNIIAGLAVSMKSTALAGARGLRRASCVAYKLAGLYGIADRGHFDAVA